MVLIRQVMALAFAAALGTVLQVGEGAAETPARPAAGGPASPAATQDAQDWPERDAAKEGRSQETKAGEDAQERDRRLDFLRLLVLGGGGHRPFGPLK